MYLRDSTKVQYTLQYCQEKKDLKYMRIALCIVIYI
jgi:hypothetical protein